MLAPHHAQLAANVFGTNVRGSSRPWSTTWLAFIDSVRVLCFGLACVGYLGVFARWGRTEAHARIVLLGLAVAIWSIIETEFDKLGYPVGVGGRLWFNFAACALFSGWALYRLWQDRPDRRLFFGRRQHRRDMRAIEDRLDDL